MTAEDEPPDEAPPAAPPSAAPPSAAPPSAAETHAAVVRGLRAYFRRHDIQALILALFSLVASAILWALIYGLIYWFSLVAATLSRSFNPATLLQIDSPDLLGRYFSLYFLAGALVSLVIARLARGRLRVERLREARFYFLWIVAELFLSVPNATLAIWGNLSALTRLRRRDAQAAARLLECLDATEGGLSLGRLRVEIEDEKTLQRVLFSLQLAGLVSVRERERGWFLCLEKPGTLALLSRPGARAN